jgi:hypothetical protein
MGFKWLFSLHTNTTMIMETKHRSVTTSTVAGLDERMQRTVISRAWSVILAMATVFLISSAASAQDLTFYNGLSCKMSVKITYSNTSCPGASPYYSQCTDLNSPGTTAVPLPTGWAKVISIQYFCGWNCSTPMTMFDCSGSYTPPLPASCCNRSITIQGALDPGEFRIDAQ